MSICELKISYAERASMASPKEKPVLRTSRDVVALMAPLLESEAVEVCYVICLAVPLTLIGYHQVSRGSLSGTPMHPREVFKVALLANAAGIILVHNHPSGNPEPSPVDLSVTARIKAAGVIIGVELLDHVIIGLCQRHVSLKEMSLL